MATKYGTGVEYGAYKSPYNLQLIGQAMAMKQQRVDANRQRLMAGIEQYMALPIDKESDRAYFQDRLQNMVTNINQKYNGADLSSDAVGRAISSEMNGVIDDKIINAVTGSAEVRGMKKYLEDVKRNNPDKYSEINASMALLPAMQWMNDGQVGSKLGNLNYVEYSDVNGNAMKAAQDLVKNHKGQVVEVVGPGGYIVQTTVDKLSPEDIKAYVQANMSDRDKAQLRVNGEYMAITQSNIFSNENIDGYVSKQNGLYDSKIKDINNLIATEKDDVQKASLNKQLQYIQSMKQEFNESIVKDANGSYNAVATATSISMFDTLNRVAQVNAFDRSSQKIRPDGIYMMERNIQARNDLAVFNAQQAMKRLDKIGENAIELQKLKNIGDGTDGTGEVPNNPAGGTNAFWANSVTTTNELITEKNDDDVFDSYNKTETNSSTMLSSVFDSFDTSLKESINSIIGQKSKDAAPTIYQLLTKDKSNLSAEEIKKYTDEANEIAQSTNREELIMRFAKPEQQKELRRMIAIRDAERKKFSDTISGMGNAFDENGNLDQAIVNIAHNMIKTDRGFNRTFTSDNGRTYTLKDLLDNHSKIEDTFLGMDAKNMVAFYLQGSNLVESSHSFNTAPEKEYISSSKAVTNNGLVFGKKDKDGVFRAIEKTQKLKIGIPIAVTSGGGSAQAEYEVPMMTEEDVRGVYGNDFTSMPIDKYEEMIKEKNKNLKKGVAGSHMEYSIKPLSEMSAMELSCVSNMAKNLGFEGYSASDILNADGSIKGGLPPKLQAGMQNFYNMVKNTIKSVGFLDVSTAIAGGIWSAIIPEGIIQNVSGGYGTHLADDPFGGTDNNYKKVWKERADFKKTSQMKTLIAGGDAYQGIKYSWDFESISSKSDKNLRDLQSSMVAEFEAAHKNSTLDVAAIKKMDITGTSDPTFPLKIKFTLGTGKSLSYAEVEISEEKARQNPYLQTLVGGNRIETKYFDASSEVGFVNPANSEDKNNSYLQYRTPKEAADFITMGSKEESAILGKMVTQYAISDKPEDVTKAKGITQISNIMHNVVSIPEGGSVLNGLKTRIYGDANKHVYMELPEIGGIKKVIIDLGEKDEVLFNDVDMYSAQQSDVLVNALHDQLSSVISSIGENGTTEEAVRNICTDNPLISYVMKLTSLKYGTDVFKDTMFYRQ